MNESNRKDIEGRPEDCILHKLEFSQSYNLEIATYTAELSCAITNFLIAQHFNVEDLSTISDELVDEYMSSQDFTDSFYKKGVEQIDNAIRTINSYRRDGNER